MSDKYRVSCRTFEGAELHANGGAAGAVRFHNGGAEVISKEIVGGEVGACQCYFAALARVHRAETIKVRYYSICIRP